MSLNTQSGDMDQPQVNVGVQGANSSGNAASLIQPSSVLMGASGASAGAASAGRQAQVDNGKVSAQKVALGWKMIEGAPKFDGTNFPQWQYQATYILETMGVFEATTRDLSKQNASE